MKRLVEAIVSAARDEGMCADLAEQFRLRVEVILTNREDYDDQTIKADHPVRKDFAACSTGYPCGADRTGYYETKGDAVRAFEAALNGHSLCFDDSELDDFPGDAGRKTVRVCDECGRCVGHAVFSWYRMGSGRYEFVGYLA